MADNQPEKKVRAVSGNRVDAVYAGIVEAMSSGEYPESGRLPTETELAQSYGVSRPTVREALSRLRLDGLIASRRGSGSYVLRRPDRNIKRFAPIESIADVQRCFAFRVALESAGAGLAADLRSTRDLEEIHAAFDQMELARNADDNASFVEHDLQFHLMIARASQNVFFVTALELIIEQMRVGMRLALNLSLERERVWREMVQIEHREIMTAIEKGSSVDAAEAMRFHLGNARRRLFEGPSQK
ncbi:FadR/GntR family transcriptional regulator [Uliginosibacterium sp. 31-16]|uniref:FadR/GntR family transcriptional regulator n=1 Tax=Uliginosibacterium sp. 31-16 TaxID=3068315 RepID=UPI00273EB119|nr:FadR/GntR family transcriptional regulator [Uliginosibacterium sp. 31-16]MDP5238141.1 FadR/GntR family transcriptional regulator [Uliginosibacterium sp. 31-16]